jgi:hypothetical protein
LLFRINYTVEIIKNPTINCTMPPTKNGKVAEPGPWTWAEKLNMNPTEIGLPELIKVYRLDLKECPYYCR